MTTPNEHTSTKADARRALIESHRSTTRSNAVVAEAAKVLGAVKASRVDNHFADKFRAIIQGGHQ